MPLYLIHHYFITSVSAEKFHLRITMLCITQSLYMIFFNLIFFSLSIVVIEYGTHASSSKDQYTFFHRGYYFFSLFSRTCYFLKSLHVRNFAISPFSNVLDVCNFSVIYKRERRLQIIIAIPTPDPFSSASTDSSALQSLHFPLHINTLISSLQHLNQMGRQTNTIHRKDIKRTVQVTRYVLNLIGVWPSQDNSSAFRIAQIKIFRILCQALLYFIFVPGVLKIFFKETNTRRRFKMIGPMCNCLMAMLKHATLICRGDRIKDCIKHIEEDWRKLNLAEDRRIMMSNSRIGRSLAILSVVFVYGSGFSYRTIMPLLRGVIITPQNVTIRPMGFDGYYGFFDPQKTPAYEITFILQFLSGFMQYSISSGTCSLAALLVLHACGQLKILIARMKDLTQIKYFYDKNANQKLAAVVRQHIRIKR